MNTIIVEGGKDMGNRIYPIGIQNFEKIRKEGYVYVDKTALMYKLVKSGSYFFLSRPRRFGKSLLISTLEAYFEAKRDLFEGLAVEALEKDWVKRPVLHLDLNIGKYDTPDSLDKILDKNLSKWEELYGTGVAESTLALRFAGAVERAYEQSGERVAILIDEYDKPLLQAIGNEELQREFRNTLKPFYGVLKTMDGCIKFALLTGVTKFGKVSVFSDLNNLNDISMDEPFISICGITEKEIHLNFEEDLHELAAAQKMTYQEVCNELKVCYELTPEELKSSPVCPHCHFHLDDNVKPVHGKLDNIESRLDALLEEWTKSLLDTVSDPLVASQKEFLGEEQQNVIDEFIETTALPKRVDDFFVKAIQALLKGFEPVVVDADDLVEKLTKLPPLDERAFRSKVNELIAGYTKGKDAGKLRIIVKK